MRLTTKGRYAVTALLDIALREDEQPLSLADISKRQHISLAYLEQLFSKLKRAGLVHSQLGAKGGYRLSSDCADITVAQVFDAVSESVDATNCGGQRSCNWGTMCLTHQLWEDLTLQIRDFMQNITLAGLVASRNKYEASGAVDCHQKQRESASKETILAVID